VTQRTLQCLSLLEQMTVWTRGVGAVILMVVTPQPDRFPFLAFTDIQTSLPQLDAYFPRVPIVNPMHPLVQIPDPFDLEH
jgi:hypothetical protein